MNTYVEAPAPSQFREFMHVRQEPGQRRRWFESDQMELIVWFADHCRPTGFQILYALRNEERALTWLAGAGFRHSLIDNGDESPLKNLTPTLGAAREIPWNHIRELFLARSRSLAADIQALVVGQLGAAR